MRAERNPALDVARIVAFFTVVCVHFFLNTDFYGITVAGKSMLVNVMMRNAFMVCVPLFMLLSGYLNCRKELSTRYYWGLLRILVSFFLCGLACSIYVSCVKEKLGFTLHGLLSGLRHYINPPYGWYVEMYVGLFLLTPFLNGMYHSLQTRRRKLVLIVTLFVLTALPSVVNIIDFATPGWWQQPSLSINYKRLIPDWWVRLYPITYYMIGAWLSEYRVKPPAWKLLLLLVGNMLLGGAFNYYRSWNSTFIFGVWQEWGALGNVVNSVLLFLLLVNLDGRRWPQWVKKLLGYVSGLTLSAYLLSYIFDSLFYPTLNQAVETVSHRVIYFPLIVPLVAVCSLILAAGVEFIQKKLVALVERVAGRKKRA